MARPLAAPADRGRIREKIYTFTGTFEEQSFGMPARAGDVDADREPDLMVAAPGLWPFTGTSGDIDQDGHG